MYSPSTYCYTYLTAYVGNNGALLRDAWPANLGKAGCDVSNDDRLSPWEMMPSTFDALTQWATVTVDDDSPMYRSSNGKRTPYALLWSPKLFNDERADSPQRVLFRVHGFLARFNVRPLGDWDG